jgi:hypothetical protein
MKGLDGGKTAVHLDMNFTALAKPSANPKAWKRLSF